MSPIEAHLMTSVAQDLAALGVPEAKVTVLSAEADDWRYRIEARDRTFEFGFSCREPLWCRELTAGREGHLVSNDHRPINTSAPARRAALRLIEHALTHPGFPPRDPPVI